MHTITNKQFDMYSISLEIKSDDPKDLVQSANFDFDDGETELLIKINPDKWDDNLEKDILSIREARDDDFWGYFDQDGFSDEDKSIYFETEFKHKMDSLILLLEQKGFVPSLLREELAEITKILKTRPETSFNLPTQGISHLPFTKFAKMPSEPLSEVNNDKESSIENSFSKLSNA